MIIYKVTNKVNGKVYIGQTRHSLETRKIRHLQCARNGYNTHFYQAIRKYGEDNFKWEILCSASSKQELNDLETYFITKYDSIKHGYNMVDGGDNNVMDIESVKTKHASIMRSDEMRKKISDTMKRKALNGELFTEEHRRKIGASQKGKKYSDERRAKCDTRSVGCYCIFKGTKHHFHSYRDAWKWWISVENPFNTTAECVCQRKIKQSISLGYYTYGRDNKKYTEPKWFREEGDVNEEVTN